MCLLPKWRRHLSLVSLGPRELPRIHVRISNTKKNLKEKIYFTQTQEEETSLEKSLWEVVGCNSDFSCGCLFSERRGHSEACCVMVRGAVVARGNRSEGTHAGHRRF